MTNPAAPADAIARSWVGYAPAFARPYLRLMRLDRPAGTWLLFWPCVFGLALGGMIGGHGHHIGADLWLIGLCAVGAIVMRGAGCTFNDIVDRDIDAQVARTRGRPLPSGAVSVRAAWIFLALQCGVGLVILLQLNRIAILLGAASLILVAIYPFMKRVTWWPQAWLGLTFNWGALLGFAARTGHLAWPAFVLYAACFFWTLGYDTIYAHQDKDDDALIGVKSTALLLNANSRAWIGFFYLTALVLFLAAAEAAPPNLEFAGLLLLAAGHFFWQVLKLDIDNPERCLTLFRANRDTGAIIAAAFLAASWLA
ncbi:MAG: 4-hydroxybenzoate octaprenyltransferase [Rhizomicrobium sp.]